MDRDSERTPRASADPCEVAVIGGGFAGLCAARHLLALRPATSIVIVDRRPLPCPAARRGVGESSSEIGAWYLARRLGLREVLERDQLIKFGLRFWLREPGGPSALDQRREFGPMGPPPQLAGVDLLEEPLEPHAYQLHRGRLEAWLAADLQDAGVRLLGGVEVRGVSLDDDGATLSLAGADAEHLRCRWVIDASAEPTLTRATIGRRARERPFDHPLAAAWWWVDARLDPVADASDEVQARCADHLRWRSTQHFVGRDYWTWLIPLADGSTSVGVVANAARQPEREPAALAAALRGLLEREEPELAALLAGATATAPVASRPEARAFAAPLHRRWLVTGAALAFLDPLYSPAHDLTALVHELGLPLIAAELDGAALGDAALREVNGRFDQILDYYEAIYRGLWPILADPRLASIKLGWDQLSYFAWLCPLAMSRRLADAGTMARLRPFGERVHRINARVQGLLQKWAARRQHGVRAPGPPGHIDLAQHATIMDHFLALDAIARSDEAASLDALVGWGAAAVDSLERFALAIFAAACDDLGLDAPDGPLDPHAIGLDPERWAADGLFEARRARASSARARLELDYLWKGEGSARGSTDS